MEPSPAQLRRINAQELSAQDFEALLGCGEPFVLTGAVNHREWRRALFTLDHAELCVRLHPRDDPPRAYYEGECAYVRASLGDFRRWLDPSDQTAPSQDSLLLRYARERFVGYADYHDMVDVFPAEALDRVDWSTFAGGAVARDGRHSTCWLGSEGAHTPTHYDSYGRNLVAQLAGVKRWRLHAPSTPIRPSRVPYEESSIFADSADAGAALPGAIEHELREGELLHVPNGWWHTVRTTRPSAHTQPCSEPWRRPRPWPPTPTQVRTTSPYALSVNTWLDCDEDDEARLREALVRPPSPSP